MAAANALRGGLLPAGDTGTGGAAVEDSSCRPSQAKPTRAGARGRLRWQEGAPLHLGSLAPASRLWVEARSNTPCGLSFPIHKTGCSSSGFYTWPSYCACGCLEEPAGRNISFIPILSLASHLRLQARIPVVGRRPILCAPDATPTKTKQSFTWRPKKQPLPDKAFLS